MADGQRTMQIFNFHVDEIRPCLTPPQVEEWSKLMTEKVKLAGFDVKKATADGIGLFVTCCGGTYDDCGGPV